MSNLYKICSHAIYANAKLSFTCLITNVGRGLVKLLLANTTPQTVWHWWSRPIYNVTFSKHVWPLIIVVITIVLYYNFVSRAFI